MDSYDFRCYNLYSNGSKIFCSHLKDEGFWINGYDFEFGFTYSQYIRWTREDRSKELNCRVEYDDFRRTIFTSKVFFYVKSILFYRL